MNDPRETFNYPSYPKKIVLFRGRKCVECKELFALNDIQYKCYFITY